MPERTEAAVQIARLEEKFASMSEGQLEMKIKMAQVEGKIDIIVNAISESKGGWKLLMLIGGLASSLSVAITWALAHISVK